MLKLDGVSKVYKVGTFGGKELHAVSNVSFDVKDGEVVSLIGESGSGKTTIGKMILGLLSIARGRLRSTELTFPPLKETNLKIIIGMYRVFFRTRLVPIIRSSRRIGFSGSSERSSSPRSRGQNGTTR